MTDEPLRNLFGDVITLPPKRSKRYVKPRGHAGTPGMGPGGETCGSCSHYLIKRWNCRTYPKCNLSTGVRRNSRGYDIRKRDLAIMNEIVKSAMILSSGLDPERRAIIAAQSLAQVIGVSMAVEAHARRALDTSRLERLTRTVFEQGRDRAFTHAMAQLVAGQSDDDLMEPTNNPPMPELSRSPQGRLIRQSP